MCECEKCESVDSTQCVIRFSVRYVGSTVEECTAITIYYYDAASALVDNLTRPYAGGAVAVSRNVRIG